MPDWLSVATGGAGGGLADAVHLLTGFQPGATPPQLPAPDAGIPGSLGSTWTTLPLFSTISAVTDHAKAAGL